MTLKQLPEPTRFLQLAQHSHPPISGWPQAVLLLAGIYNLLFGLWALTAPSHYLALQALPTESAPLWQCIGMIVGLYGLAYLLASTDIERYWPIVGIGLLGKLLGPLGYFYYLWQGLLSPSGLWVIFFNDLIWIVPFFIITIKGFHSHWRSKWGIPTVDNRSLLSNYQRLYELSSQQKVLLVFLRHLGCTFCHQALVRLATEADTLRQRGFEPVIVHMGPEEKLSAYLAQQGLSEILHLEDTHQVMYRLFGLHRGSLFNAFSPRIFIKAFHAIKTPGVGIGRLHGDGFQLAGCFVVDAGEIVKDHRETSVTNEIDYLEFVQEDSTVVSNSTLRLFYDRDCPLCRREVEFLRSLTPSQRVTYVDISKASFDAQKAGLDYQTLMREIHAKDSNGNWLRGMDAFRAVYAYTPYRRIAALSALPLVRTVFDMGYRIFARNRLRITGRSGAECAQCKQQG